MRVISQPSLKKMNETNTNFKNQLIRLYEDNVKLAEDLRRLNETNIQCTKDLESTEHRNTRVGGDFRRLHKVNWELDIEIKRKDMLIEELHERIADLEEAVISGATERNNLEAILFEKQTRLPRHSRPRCPEMIYATHQPSAKNANQGNIFDTHKGGIGQDNFTGQQYRGINRDASPSLAAPYNGLTTAHLLTRESEPHYYRSYNLSARSPRTISRSRMTPSIRHLITEANPEHRQGRDAILQEETKRYSGAR